MFSISDFLSFGCIFRGGAAGSRGGSLFDVLKDLYPIFPVSAPIHVPTNSPQRFPCSIASLTLVISSLFQSHSDRCEVGSHCGFHSSFLHANVLMCFFFS